MKSREKKFETEKARNLSIAKRLLGGLEIRQLKRAGKCANCEESIPPGGMSLRYKEHGYRGIMERGICMICAGEIKDEIKECFSHIVDNIPDLPDELREQRFVKVSKRTPAKATNELEMLNLVNITEEQLKTLTPMQVMEIRVFGKVLD
jgi:hypothetical protein